MKAAAVFLDRDGTIIDDRGYIGDADDVEVLPGSVDAIRRFSDAGYLIVVASNQSGIARGLLDEDDLSAVHARMEEFLSQEGVAIDGAYYCPYLDGPEAKVKTYRRDSELRKPKPGMLLQAAREMNIDLRRSWMIGDSPTDVKAGARAGCQTIWLGNGEAEPAESKVEATHVAQDLTEAADLILGKRKNKGGAVMSRPKHEPTTDPEVADWLQRIHELIDRGQRTKRQDDFSVIRLFAGLLQMFAIIAALWGASALLHDDYPPATARFLLASFLQLASISAFAADYFR